MLFEVSELQSGNGKIMTTLRVEKIKFTVMVLPESPRAR